MANPAIVVDFLANTAGLRKGLREAEGSTNSLGSKMKSLGKAGAVGAAVAGIGALTEAVHIGIGEWTESTKVAAQTAAVIKSTGDVSHVTAKHVEDLGTSLMKKSGIDDEAIKSGENLLLTFTNIRNEAGKGNDVFDQTTKAATDMSVALGTDVSKAAMQLGKALNDPSKGLAKLGRQGVQFTDAQKNLIKSLQASGDTLGAQKVILKEVNKEFGGSAEAAGKTLPGQINIAKESFKNFAGDLVGKFIPILEDVIGWLRDHWPEISKAIDQMWQSVQPILKNLGDLFASVVQIVQDNWPLIGPVISGFAKVVKDVASIIATALKLVTDLLKGDWSAAWDDAKKIVKTAIDAIKTEITTELTLVGAVAKKLGGAILKGVTDGLEGIGAAAWGVIDNIGQWISDKEKTIVAWGTGIADHIKTAVVNTLVGIGSDAWNVINNIGTWIVNEASTIVGWGTSVGGKVKGAVVTGLTGIGSDAWDAIKGIGTWIANEAKTIAGWGSDLAGKIVAAFVAELGKIGGQIEAAIKAPINAVIGAWNSLHLPSIGFSILGHNFSSPNIGLPNISYLAAGGIVTSPTLAMVGEAGPEAVIPLGRGGAPVEVRVFIGDTELRGLVRTEVITENNRTAQTLLAGLV